MSAEVVIEGSGGREHALALAMLDGPLGDVRVHVDPGNAGTHGAGFLYYRPENPDLVIVGPEAPLIEGRADQLARQGINVLGINQEASFLEASKVDAGEFMKRHGILHPPFKTVHNYDEAMAAIAGRPATDYVLKAEKPAGGKGVVLPKDENEAINTIRGMLSGELFGGAGKERFQVQDRWHGPEVSVFVVGDGTPDGYYVIPYFSQDHKRLLDGDRGPNTGGMGAYAPVPESIISEDQLEKIHEAIDKTYAGLATEGFNSKGVLYFGFMLAEEAGGDPAIIEYNIRFGDPEAQVVLPLLSEQVDTYDLFRSAAAGNLRPDEFNVPAEEILGQAALTVCLAAEGYPDSPVKGKYISRLNREYEDVIIHHAGTKRDQFGGGVRTAGGRVLYVTGLGTDVDEAAKHAYAAIGANGIYFEGVQHRSDIGWQVRGQS